MEPRSFGVQIFYNHVEATEDISPYLNSFTYTDPIDESDTIAISLLDREGTWAAGWIPKKEDQIRPNILLRNWLADGERRTIICGDFMVDDFSFSGPPDMLTINGISSPLNTEFKETSRSQTWKNVTLRQIGEEIAARYGMSLFYEGEEVPIEKMEQSRQTDADFLKKLAEKYGFALKTYSGRLILFSWEVYENQPAKSVIRKQDVRRWSYHSSMLGTYTGAKVSYTVPKTKKTVEVMVGTEGRIYNSTEKADSPADAERIGKNAIRNANRKETTVTLTLNPVVFLTVSDNVELQGFGNLDGRYQIGKIVHQISRGDYSIQISGWRLPDAEGGQAEQDPAASGGYEVQSGDTLWDLAVRFYGSGTKASAIYEANRDVIEEEAKKRGKGSSSSGYWIFPGMKLTIP